MKTQLVTLALMIAGLSLNAQTTEKKEATVRIKKVENINGVEKITDTTFTTNDPEKIKLPEGVNIQTIDISNGKPGEKMEKMVIVSHDEVITSDGQEVRIDHKGMSKDVEAEMEKALKEAGVDPNAKGVKKVIIIDEDSNTASGSKTEPKTSKTTKIIMLKMDITDASSDDMKRIGAGNVDNKVELDNMKLYPNPNDGKFNLNFNLKNKGDAEVTVYDMQGKQVYNEKLSNFSGEYNKPIDISSNAKGIYFVKIQQGQHTQVKKISLD